MTIKKVIGVGVIALILLVSLYIANKPLNEEVDRLRTQVIDMQLAMNEIQERGIKLEFFPDLSRFEADMKARELEITLEDQGDIAITTAYSCEGITTDAEMRMNCPSKFNPKYPAGRTASGTIPSTMLTVACDPSMLGKRIYLEGIGEKICEDTGSAIKGNRVDIYVSHIDEAYAWGVRLVRYFVVD